MSAAPVDITCIQKNKILNIKFDDDKKFALPCLYLRERSPSAEARHAEPGETINPEVNIIGIDPVGNYAIKIIFDDGHETGIYSWDFLYELGLEFEKAKSEKV